jgi:hypothetical protein
MHRKNTQLLSIAAALACFLAAGNAMALSIAELEPNDTLATAQNIDPFFSVGPNVNILNSTTVPWVSISATGDGTYDYYSFTVTAPGQVHLDIDFGHNVGGSIDTELALWDSLGNALVQVDDSPLDPGSISGFDSEIFFDIVTPGLYIVGVAEFPANALFGGWAPGDEPDAGDTYTLQVSVVPEPGATILFGIGALIAGSVLRRKA